MRVSLVILSIVFIAVVAIGLRFVIRYSRTHSRSRVIVFGLWGAMLGGLSTVALSGGYSPWFDDFPNLFCLGGLLIGALVGVLIGRSWAELADGSLHRWLLIISWLGLSAGLAFLNAIPFVIYHATIGDDEVVIAAAGVSVTLLITILILTFAATRPRSAF